MTSKNSPETLEEGVEDTSLHKSLEDYTQLLREKIIFGLQVYPYLSPTMLHVFLGTAVSTHVWKPILNDLIVEGVVQKDEVQLTSPHDRVQSYTVLHLTTNPYIQPACFDSKNSGE